MKEHVPQEPLVSTATDVPTRIILTGVRSAFIGPNLTLDAHRTAVATILVGLETDITITGFKNEEETIKTGPVHLMPPGTLCQLKTEGRLAILFCDALTDDYAPVDRSFLDSQVFALRQLLRRGPGTMQPDKYLEDVFQMLGISSARSPRPDMARIVAAIGREPENFATVETAAAFIDLSPTHFQHVFTEAIGMPFRRYRQWRRMGRVIRTIAQGYNLTEAAHAAGFANSGHLSTAFKAMFGLRPSDIITSHVEYHLADANNAERLNTQYRLT